MAKQKLWFKKRTTRGGGREVNGKTKLTPKNATREIFKNQRVYAHFFLKFVIFLILGMTWLRLGAPVFGLAAAPIGLMIGLIVALFERFRIGRGIEIAILVVAAVASYFFDVGIVF
ncbi:hypothetical protein FWF74_00650 [Candidatus Saccharibacteria bacterium]|nr:hypothetical protein [Candidatus Saccharibacteria bacterium]MCL1963312.1 hypothetical protein [Candidatus Saccharibacteria bacterium]